MMKKKGISPLIATVLIIGFVIVLAALVMQWGGGLFKSVQEETGKTSDLKITCSSGLTGLEISVDETAVTIDNKNNQALEGFMIRGYNDDGSLGEVYSTDVDAEGTQPLGCPGKNACGLPAYGMKTYTMGSAHDSVGVFPIVKLSDGDALPCENEWTAA